MQTRPIVLLSAWNDDGKPVERWNPASVGGVLPCVRIVGEPMPDLVFVEAAATADGEALWRVSAEPIDHPTLGEAFAPTGSLTATDLDDTVLQGGEIWLRAIVEDEMLALMYISTTL